MSGAVKSMEERAMGKRLSDARRVVYERCWAHGDCPQCGSRDMTYARNKRGWMCQRCNVKTSGRD